MHQNKQTNMDEQATAIIHYAMDFATEKHAGQFRKNSKKEPYIRHPTQVMLLLEKHGVEDPEILSAAILHDVVEDTDATIEEIERKFGKRISSIVAEVTDDKSLPKVERKKLQLSTISEKSLGARMIKIADKWHNTQDLLVDPPKDWSDDRIRGYIKWSEEVCKNAMKPGDIPWGLKVMIERHFGDRIHTELFDDDILERYYAMC